MYASLGITLDQLNGDLYSAWLRDTHEKNNSESRAFFHSVMQHGFAEEHVISLPNQRLGINFIHSLAPLLHRSSLTKLNVHGNALRDGGVEIVAHFLLDLPHLTELDIGANDLNGSCAFLLAQNIALHDKLQVLIIGSSSSSSYSSTSYSSTSVIDENYMNHFSPESASILLEGCLRCSSLKVLDLSGNPILHTPPRETQITKNNATNTNTHASHNTSTALSTSSPSKVAKTATAAVAEVGPGAQAVKSQLQVVNNKDTNSTTKHNTETHSEEILARKNEITEAIMSCEESPVTLLEQLISTSRSLTTLHLQNVQLSVGNALILIKAMGLNNSLMTINLCDNKLPAMIGDALGNLLLARSSAHNNIPLSKLMLSDNNLFDNKPMSGHNIHGTDVVMAHKYYMSGYGNSSAFNSPASEGTHSKNFNYIESNKGPKRNTKITNDKQDEMECKTLSKLLRLRHQSEWHRSQEEEHYQSQHQQLLLSSLANDHVLTLLSLDGCMVGDVALSILCRSLINNHTLLTLSLSHNAITHEGALNLGRALCCHPCMSELHLAYNTRIGDDGCCGLAYVLRENESLVKLNLSCTGMNDKGLLALAQALSTNKTLHVLNVSRNHFTSAAADCFAAVLTQNSSLIACNFNSTSISHQTLLQVQKILRRNECNLKDAEPNALRKELIRLHFQKYKLDEAKNELELLKDKSAEVKRASEHFDLQCKQDQSDYTRRIRELQEQQENYAAQATRCAAQETKIVADLEAAHANFEVEMSALQNELESATNHRKEVEGVFHSVENELAEWNSAEAAELRRQGRLARLTELKHSIHSLNEQRKEQRMKNDELQNKLLSLEGHTTISSGAKSTSTSAISAVRLKKTVKKGNADSKSRSNSNKKKK